MDSVAFVSRSVSSRVFWNVKPSCIQGLAQLRSQAGFRREARLTSRDARREENVLYMVGLESKLLTGGYPGLQMCPLQRALIALATRLPLPH